MSNLPLVSVVICSHNREHYISQAIDSVLAQRGDFSLEIIVGDDCSIDGSRALIDEYDRKYPGTFILNYQKTNQGLGRNWASCVLLAKGDYLAFCDDDDYWCSDRRLAETVGFLEQNPEYGLAYTGWNILNDDTGKITGAGRDISGLGSQTAVINNDMSIFFGTCVIRRSVMMENINFQDYIDLNFSIQDWPTLMLLSPHTKFRYFEEKSVVYRVYEGSMSHPQTYESVIAKYAREKEVLKYVDSKLGKGKYYDEASWGSYVNHLLVAVAYKRNDYLKAKEYSRHVKNKDRMERMAATRITFYSYRFLKMLKQNKTR